GAALAATKARTSASHIKDDQALPFRLCICVRPHRAPLPFFSARFPKRQIRVPSKRTKNQNPRPAHERNSIRPPPPRTVRAQQPDELPTAFDTKTRQAEASRGSSSPAPPKASHHKRVPSWTTCPGTYPTVGRRPVPAASPDQRGSIPDRPAAACPPGPSSAGSTATAARSSSSPASTATGPASSATLAIQLNNIVQRHIHFVAHDGGSLRLPGPILPAALRRDRKRMRRGDKKTRERSAILNVVCSLDTMKVKIKSWHGVASWLWVANDENCGICRMAFNGCCPDCE
ncbi:hypothetical protein lerEdw1_017767, partial [Lerista edwardsae]